LTWEVEVLGDSIIQAMVTTSRPDASKAFYQDVLGLKLLSEDQFGIQFAGKIGFLRIAKAPGMLPAAHAVMNFIVDDATAVARALAGKNVKFERYGFLQQDEDGIWSSPEGAKVGWFRDPDMNLIGLVQNP
jgi:catechol 2,3-dioxygenase-like lactoylglutathione lyase family enzyme